MRIWECDHNVTHRNELFLLSIVTAVQKVMENLSLFLSPYLQDIVTQVRGLGYHIRVQVSPPVHFKVNYFIYIRNNWILCCTMYWLLNSVQFVIQNLIIQDLSCKTALILVDLLSLWQPGRCTTKSTHSTEAQGYQVLSVVPSKHIVWLKMFNAYY